MYLRVDTALYYSIVVYYIKMSLKPQLYTQVNHTVHTALATDLDSANVGSIVYKLDRVTEIATSPSPNRTDDLRSMFSVDRLTGVVRLDGILDRERTATYEFRITAMDSYGSKGGLSAYQTVVVRVSDVNDNPPVVTLNSLGHGVTHGNHRGDDATVQENLDAGAFVALVDVTDEDDIGNNSKVHCGVWIHLPSELKGTGENYFSLETLDNDYSEDAVVIGQQGRAQFKLVTTRPLDREIVSSFHLDVLCTDLGIPSLTSAKASLVVRVGDVDDNGPSFVRDYLNVDIDENTPVGKVLMDIGQRIEDADEIVSSVVYELLWSAESVRDAPVIVNAASGQLTCGRLLDYETEARSYEATVVATDARGRNATYLLNVRIRDVNDERPRFVNPGTRTVYVHENARLAADVAGAWISRDEDATPAYARHICSIRHPAISPFSVHPYTCQISLEASLDRELVEVYDLVLAVTDVDRPDLFDTLHLKVVVVDVNDNPPIFRLPPAAMVNRTVSVSLDTPKGSTIYTTLASDPDSQPTLSYSLIDAEDIGDEERGLAVGDTSYSGLPDGVVWDNDNVFAVDAVQGGVKITRILDNDDLGKVFALIVRVTDGYHVTQTRVQLKVTPAKEMIISKGKPSVELLPQWYSCVPVFT